MGFLDKIRFSRLKDGLTKTRDGVLDKVSRVIRAKRKIDDSLLDEIEEILIVGDVGVATTARIIENLRERVKKERYEDSSELFHLIREEVAGLFKEDVIETDGTSIGVPKNMHPYVVMVVGVNGVGKTTTIGKLAHNYRRSGNDVVIGAADTFRAAANEQLEIWAQRAGVDIVQQQHGSDPAAVAFDTLQSAIAKNADVVIIDTAGRLHTKSNLMEELKKISRVMGKLMQDAPHEVLLVLDATTGQNAIQQAQQFTAAVGVTGLAVTKLDGTAKGGVVIGISSELSIPVKYIGVGEKIDDLQVFDRDAFIDALFATFIPEIPNHDREGYDPWRKQEAAMMFKRPQHNVFDYTPRYYDPSKDEVARRRGRLHFRRPPRRKSGKSLVWIVMMLALVVAAYYILIR